MENPPKSHQPARWYQLPRLWRVATGWQRFRTVFPLALLLLTPMLGGFGMVYLLAVVMLLAGLTLLIRLPLFWFRRGQPARLTSWRLPLILPVGVLAIQVFFASLDAALDATGELMLAVSEDLRSGDVPPRWPCGRDVEKGRDGECRVTLGWPWMQHGVRFSIDPHAEQPTYRAVLYAFPDHSYRFEATAASALMTADIENNVSTTDLRS